MILPNPDLCTLLGPAREYKHKCLLLLLPLLTKASSLLYCSFHQRLTLLLQLMRLCGFRSVSYKREDLFQIAHQHRCNQRGVNVGEEEEDEGDIADCVLRWRKEFWLCRKLLLVYPEHEALWQHRRFLFWYWHCELNHKFPLTIYVLLQA
ncbi:Protein prenyltransferase alpha subunit repeat-containing protein 1 [Balamuthia mandrillaris]